MRRVPESQILSYGAYCHIAEFLQHYNRIQSAYRTFASTWILATFVGMGYALSNKGLDLPFHPLIAVSFIALASATGIFLIWYLDLIVCEQSIATVVHAGIEMESVHRWLPRYYHNVNYLSKLLGYINSKSIFYIGLLSILFITMGSALTVYVAMKSVFLSYFVPFLTLCLIATVILVLLFSMKRSDPYKQLSLTKGKRRVRRSVP